MKVLLTGGSGFLALHCLDTLLKRGHSVVTTVRSTAKGDKVLAAHPGLPKSKLTYAIVPDVAQDGVFDEVVKSEAFDAVIHTASPFHFQHKDPAEILDPAIKGTTGILKSIKAYAPSVKRVVITSSFAALSQMKEQPEVYDDTIWNPVTYQQGVEDPMQTYMASKTLAERAAWSFVKEEKPSFTLATITPPWIFGPVHKDFVTQSSVNTSNGIFLGLLHGAWAEKLPPTMAYIWVDVRDVALAHVKAAEVPEAGGNRFFLVSSYFDFKEAFEIAKKHFPEIKLPAQMESDKPAKLYGFDVEKSKKILGLEYIPLEKTVVDTIKSLQELKA